MARIYSRKKGASGSTKPPVKIIPKWMKHDAKEVEKLVIELSRERNSSSQVGAILRDQYGVPNARLAMKKRVTDVMRKGNMYPDYPEDLMSLFKKAVFLHEHIGANKKDKKAVKGLEHLESKIRRLVKYYAREGKVPSNFQYEPDKVKLIIQK